MQHVNRLERYRRFEAPVTEKPAPLSARIAAKWRTLSDCAVRIALLAGMAALVWASFTLCKILEIMQTFERR